MRKNIWDTSITSFISAELERNPFNPEEYIYIDKFTNKMSKKYLSGAAPVRASIPRECLADFFTGLTLSELQDIKDYLNSMYEKEISFQKSFQAIQTIINILNAGKPHYNINQLNTIAVFVYGNYLESAKNQLQLAPSMDDSLVIDLFSRQLRKIKFSSSEYELYRKLITQYQEQGFTDYEEARAEIIGSHHYFSNTAFDEIIKNQRVDIVSKRRRVERLVSAANISLDIDHFDNNELSDVSPNGTPIDSETQLEESYQTIKVLDGKAKAKKLINPRT